MPVPRARTRPPAAADSDVGVTLRDLIEVELASVRHEIDALNELTQARFVTFRTLIDSSADKVALALASSDKAVAKAETATEKRFDSVNEFRAALSELSALMATRRELESAITAVYLRVDGVAERLTELTTRMDTADGKSKGVTSSFGFLAAAISTVVIVVNVVLFALTR